MANNIKYLEIYESLRADILAGKYKVGELLPPELTFCEQLGIGRSTLRRVLEMLSEEGLVSSRQGRGTMVISSGIKNNHISAYQPVVMCLQPRLPKGEPCAYTQSPLVIDSVFASDKVAEQMGLPEGSRVFRVQRIRYVNNNPCSFMVNYINPAIAPDLDKDDEDIGEHLSEYIVRRYGIRRTGHKLKMEIHLAQFKEAQFLHLELNRPLFLMTRVSYFNGEIFDYSEHMYNPDLIDVCLLQNTNPRIDEDTEHLPDITND